MKKTLAMLLALVMVLSLVVACAGNTTPAPTATATDAPKADAPAAAATEAPKAEEPAAEPTAEPEPEIPWDGAYMDRDDFKAYTKHDLETVVAAIEDQLDDATYTAVKAAKEAGDAAIDAANTLAEVRGAHDDAFKAIVEAIPVADGIYSFKKENNTERGNILGILEQFAVAKGITGISLRHSAGGQYHR